MPITFATSAFLLRLKAARPATGFLSPTKVQVRLPTPQITLFQRKIRIITLLTVREAMLFLREA